MNADQRINRELESNSDRTYDGIPSESRTRAAALAIISELSERGGFDDCFYSLDDKECRKEIVDAIEQIIIASR